MISPSDIKVGILDANCDSYFVDDCVRRLVEQGCNRANIQIRKVPCSDFAALGVLFFAEYTDVDGVIILSSPLIEGSAIEKALIDLQIQWNMPVAYDCHGTSTLERDIVQMIRLQSEMAESAEQYDESGSLFRRETNPQKVN